MVNISSSMVPILMVTLLLPFLAHSRDPEKLEGLGAWGPATNFIHGPMHRPRGLRRIEAVEEEQVEGRFFLQEKLCALGLAECENGEIIKYVQPVQVVPVGQPVPQHLVGDQPHIPTQIVGAGTKAEHSGSPSASYYPSYDPPKPVYNPQEPDYDHQKPNHGSPKPSYQPPKPVYNPSYTAPKPVYKAPKPSYEPPKPSYDPPKPSYEPPKPGYEPPKSIFGPQKPSYEVQTPSYNTPKPSYNAPKSPKPSYNIPNPTYNVPNPTHNVPSPSYNVPNPSYNVPNPSYNVPNPSYNAPKPSYTAPKPSYEAPRPSYNPPKLSKPAYVPPVYVPNSYEPIIDVKTKPDSPYSTSFSNLDDTESAYDFESIRVERCVCVPVAQCPTGNIFSPVKTDYSGLVDPRQKFSKGVILSNRANGSRSLKLNDKVVDEEESVEESQREEKSLEGTDDSAVNFGEDTEEVGVEQSKRKAKSLEAKDDSAVDFGEVTPIEDDTEDEELLVEDLSLELNRRRRDAEDMFPRKRSRLENTFVPEETKETPEVIEVNEPSEISEDEVENIEGRTKEDGIESAIAEEKEEIEAIDTTELPYSIESRDTDIDIVSDLKQRLKDERRKERIRNRKNKNKNNSKTEDILNESDIADYDSQDKSFDSLSSFTSDVSDKVGTVGTSVTSGVSKIFGDLSTLLGTSTATGQLQPTVGFSFGLPQNTPGYGGYPNNPVGTGGATNPYYTAADGLEFGAVNVNPLFSFQAGTTDTGELALKPLVNLHLVPNGCGILGCKESEFFKEYNEYGEPTLTKTISDVLKDPLAFLHGDKKKHQHTISAEYTAPGYYPDTQYQTGYPNTQSQSGYPDSHYQTGYGTPNYQVAQDGFVPSAGYVAPNGGDGYGAPAYNPQDNYGAPLAPQYNTPQTGGHGHDSVHGHNSGHSNDNGHGHNSGHVNHNGHNSGHGADDHEPTAGGPTVTNIHHHFYHNKPNNQAPSYNDNGFYQDSEVFKRETVPNAAGTVPNSAGILPANMPSGATIVKAPSSVSVQGFKFPGSRAVDRVREKRRGDREPHSIEVGDQQTVNGPTKASTKRFVASTCGGPGSGYVCCKNF